MQGLAEFLNGFARRGTRNLRVYLVDLRVYLRVFYVYHACYK